MKNVIKPQSYFVDAFEYCVFRGRESAENFLLDDGWLGERRYEMWRWRKRDIFLSKTKQLNFLIYIIRTWEIGRRCEARNETNAKLCYVNSRWREKEKKRVVSAFSYASIWYRIGKFYFSLPIRWGKAKLRKV